MLMSTNQIITNTSFLSVSIGALILLPTAQQEDVATYAMLFKIQELEERNTGMENQLNEELKRHETILSANKEMTDSLMRGLTVERCQHHKLKEHSKILEQMVSKRDTKIDGLLKALQVNQVTKKCLLLDQRMNVLRLAQVVISFIVFN